MLAEWTIFTQVSGVQWCPGSSRQVAADDLRPVHVIIVAGRTARPLQRAHPLCALLLPRADDFDAGGVVCDLRLLAGGL